MRVRRDRSANCRAPTVPRTVRTRRAADRPRRACKTMNKPGWQVRAMGAPPGARLARAQQDRVIAAGRSGALSTGRCENVTNSIFSRAFQRVYLLHRDEGTDP
jgi:hypothetical protein